MSAHILIIEDEADIARILADLLRAEGFQITIAAHATAGLAAVQQTPPDLILLDLMLPGMSGMEACRRARAGGFQGGILMLSARGQMPDRVEGLRIGADDYIVKPYHPDDLLARIAAILRRVRRDSGAVPQIASFSGITADLRAQTFTLADGQPLHLSAKESALLCHLIAHSGTTVSRDALLAEIWPEQPAITPRTVDVHIAWLRKKIERDPAVPKHIITDRGVGYRFGF